MLPPGVRSCRSTVVWVQHARRVSTITETEKLEHVQPFSAIPGPTRLPALGSLWLYKLGLYQMPYYHEVLRTLHDKYGPVVREQFGANCVVHLFDPEHVRLVHQKEGKYPEVPPLQETALVYRRQKGMSLGLGNTNGEEWHRLRSAVQQMMMRPRQVSGYLPLVNSVSRAFTDRLERDVVDDGSVPDLDRLVYKWALESSCLVCTERKFGALAAGEESERLADRLIDANRLIFRLSARLKFSVPLYKYITTPNWVRLIRAEDYFYSVAMRLFDSALTEVREKVERNELGEDEFSFLAYLLSRDSMSHNDVLIIAFSMFSDGLSTTVPAMAAALWCLAHAPDIQARLYRDICDVMPSSSPTAQSDVTADVINRLPLLRAVLKEALRLYPIGTEVSRRTDTDLILGGYHIPAGTHVDLNQSIHLRSSQCFSDPDRFWPDRWIGDQRKQIHPYLHIPFGHGTRMCAGRRFAEQDIHTTLVHVLRRFQLLPAADSQSDFMRQRYETLLVPDKPLTLRFVPRND